MNGRGLVAAVLCGAAALAGCDGGGEAGQLTFAEAFCNDLDAGYPPLQILAPLVQDGTYTPQVAADRAYAWAAEGCPQHLRANETLRSYLQGWGINPDA